MEIAKEQNLSKQDLSSNGYIKKGMISHFEKEYGQLLLDDSYALKDSESVLFENPYTTEFVVDVKDFSSASAMSGIAWVKGARFVQYSFLIRPATSIDCGARGSAVYEPQFPLEIGARHFISVICDGIKQMIWKDGYVWMTTSRTTNNFTSGYSPTCGNVKYDSNYADVHCFRVYNRVLTEDEIIKNYSIDKKRFGI